MIVCSSAGVRLLADIRQILDERGVDRISSADLADALVAPETSQWAEFSRGKPLTAPKLARMLARFEITPGTIRVEDKTPKGYYRRDFEDAFACYLPPPKRNTATRPMDIEESVDFQSATQRACGGRENERNPNEDAGCGVVAVSTPGGQGVSGSLFPADISR